MSMPVIRSVLVPYLTPRDIRCMRSVSRRTRDGLPQLLHPLCPGQQHVCASMGCHRRQIIFDHFDPFIPQGQRRPSSFWCFLALSPLYVIPIIRLMIKHDASQFHRYDLAVCMYTKMWDLSCVCDPYHIRYGGISRRCIHPATTTRIRSHQCLECMLNSYPPRTNDDLDVSISMMLYMIIVVWTMFVIYTCFVDSVL